ncbi:hypothetical protein N7528_003675 [Penicillium herquei]|nr:hypothetical protein N7528_003675 [Penicillium herquei]
MSSFNMDEARLLSRGSDNELAYASPVAPYWKGSPPKTGGGHRRPRASDIAYHEGIQPRAYRIEAGLMGDDGRKRRCLGCSSDRGDRIDGFTNEVHRVGGPYICSLPVETIENYSPHGIISRVQVPKNKTLKTIEGILRKHKIEPCCPVKFVGRRSRFNPEPQPVSTCLVYCTGPTLTWLDAAKEIRQFLRFEKLRDVSIEIIRPGYENPRDTFPIQKEDRITGLWFEIQNAIVAAIDLDDILSFGCYRRGRSKVVEETIPTILVIVNSRSRKEWKTTREQIVGVLNEFKYPEVAVEIVKDEIRTDPSTTAGLNRVLLSSGMAKAGQSIAPSRNHKESWTLGGFVELLDPERDRWSTFGLTCFHCVMPDPERISPSLVPKMKKWYHNGVDYDDDGTDDLLTVDQPTICALDNQRKKVELELDKGNQDRDPYATVHVEGVGKVGNLDLTLPHRKQAREAKDFLEELDKFTNADKQGLGFLAMGSGMDQVLEKSELWGDTHCVWNANVEWALVELHENRRPTNAVDSGFLREFPKGHDRDLTKGPVYSLGHGSGAITKGLANPLADFVLDHGGKLEVRDKFGKRASTVVGVGGDRFSAPGDTGSLVFTKDKFVVGMVSGRTYFNSLTYYMEIHDIFKHIMDFTSARQVRMYQG